MNIGRTHFLPLPLLADIGGSMLRLQRRSLAADAATLLAATVPTPRQEGEEHIPLAGSGPLLVVSNHYQRSGLWIGYAGALIADAVWRRREEEVRIMVIDRVRAPIPWDKQGRQTDLPGTRWLFRRVAVAWDMVPMSVVEDDRGGRGAAVRRLATAVLPPPRGQGRVGVLFPEGYHGHHRHLSEALPGVGMLVTLLCGAGVRLLPVGIYEDGATPVARFGPPFTVARARGIPRDEADRQARAEVMARIAALLPERLRVVSG